MVEVIACANQKGGVGKTTTVLSIGAYLALDGLRVLIVDVDPQGNATSGLGVDRDSLSRSVYDVLVGDADVASVVRKTSVENLSILPSDRSLAGAEVELVPERARERRLRRVLREDLAGYDFVLLDCPPSLGLLTVNALTAADSVLIPLQCEYYALEGLSQLMGTIELIREHLNPDLTLKGVVLTMHDGRTALAADVANEVRRHLGEQVFDTIVPRSIRLAEAPSYGRPIPHYSAASRGAVAYRSVTVELLRRSGRQPGPALSIGAHQGARQEGSYAQAVTP